jgi:hypothetical protein
VRALAIERPRSVTAGVLRPGSAAKFVPGGQAGGGSCEGAESLRGRLPGREAGRLGMGPRECPVTTSLRLPGQQVTVRWQIWQRVTGRWVTVTGKRREPGLLIRPGDARPVAVTVPCAAGTLHGTHEGSWSAVRGEQWVN